MKAYHTSLCSTLAPGESLTVPTSMTNGTLVDGNLAQCAKVISNDTSFANPNEYIVPGEYALAAVDGANAVSRRFFFSHFCFFPFELTGFVSEN